MVGPVVYGENASGNAPPTDTAITGASYGYNGAQGKLTDATTGITIMGDRPYMASTGRFLQPDPIEGGCANQYTYGFGDPVNHPDLTGRSTCKWQKRAIAPGPDSGDIYTDGTPIGIQIVNRTLFPGSFEISDQWGQYYVFNSLGWSTSGIMKFDPALVFAFGNNGGPMQEEYQIGINFNGVPILSRQDEGMGYEGGDTASAAIVVNVYTPVLGTC